MSEDMHAEDREAVKLALSAATGFWNDKVSGDAVDQAESALLSHLAALRVSLANETRRRKAAEDERDQHEAEWSAELAALHAEIARLRSRTGDTET